MTTQNWFKALPFVPLALVGLGLLLHIVGLATKEWFTVMNYEEDEKVTVGLWLACSQSVCVDITDEEYSEDWIRACQAMAILGMSAGLAAAGASAAIPFFKYSSRDLPSVVGPAATVLGFLALVFIAICAIVFSVELDDDIGDAVDIDGGYSLGLSSVGGSLMLIGGIAAFFAARAN